MNKTKCPNAHNHAQQPECPVEWREWALKKMLTHEKVKCSSCGLYEIWIPINSEDALQNLRTEIYQVVLKYSESREGKGFSGSGHHFAQKVSALVGQMFSERIGESGMELNTKIEELIDSMKIL